MPSKFLSLLLLYTLGSLALAVSAQEKAPTPKGVSFGVAYYDAGEIRPSHHSDYKRNKRSKSQPTINVQPGYYHRKIKHTVRIIDSMALPVMVLYGVEDEQVVRDLVEMSKCDYAYIHREQNIDNGLEFTVLYKADRFVPETVTTWQGALAIEGSCNNVPITIIANARSSSIKVLMDRINVDAKTDNIILMGQIPDATMELLKPHNDTPTPHLKGKVNVVAAKRWISRDRAITNIRGKQHCGVFIRDWLLDDSGKHLDVFSSKQHYGSYTKSVPIYIYFEDLFAY